jgi:hypothetical protein
MPLHGTMHRRRFLNCDLEKFRTLLVAPLIIVLFTSTCVRAQTLKRYYIIADPANQRCRVIDQQPSTEIITSQERLASDSIYILRDDALAAIKTLPLCQPKPKDR